MRTIQREIVSGLIFSADNKILFGKKDPAKGGVYSDCIHLPGGGIEQGEAVQARYDRPTGDREGHQTKGEQISARPVGTGNGASSFYEQPSHHYNNM